MDADDFDRAKLLIVENCIYRIGDEELVGPDQIVQSYEQNMIEGRRKLDKLVWGDCRVERIDEHSFLIHFTDYLTHQEQSYTHRCTQRVTFDDTHRIVAIQHIDDPEATQRLNAFFERVGIA